MCKYMCVFKYVFSSTVVAVVVAAPAAFAMPCYHEIESVSAFTLPISW